MPFEFYFLACIVAPIAVLAILPRWFWRPIAQEIHRILRGD